jgi:hypothetical protein
MNVGTCWKPLGRRAIALLSAATIAMGSMFAATPVVRADYSGQCDFGTQGFYETFTGVAASQSTSGAIWGSYADTTYGQDPVACAFPFPNSGGSWVEGANIAGTAGPDIVQLAIGQAAGEGTTFWYTPSDNSGGVAVHVPSGFYPWSIVLSHAYREFIWENNGIWDLCIDDLTSNNEGCDTITRNWTTVISEYQAYETHNTNDQIGPKCCAGLGPLDVYNMHYMPNYLGNRSWAGPMANTVMHTVGAQPSYYKWEWVNSTTFEAYTTNH